MIDFNYNYDYDKAIEDKNKILNLIDYPYLKYYVSEKTIMETFNNLKKSKPHIVNRPFYINNVKLEKNDLKYNNTNILIMSTNDEYEKINRISDYFNEKCRIECQFFGSIGTVEEYYKKHFDKIIDHMRENKLQITIENIRDTIFKYGKKDKFGECSTFRPNLMKYIIEHFNSKKILDMSSGWGDRLVGAMACNIDCYHGFDPNSCLQPGYNKIIDFFKEEMLNKDADLKIEELPFEKAILQDNYYDLMFTSPPYFDIEIYDSNSETQSTHKQSEESWYNSYMKVWIEIIYKALKINGKMIFNINQFQHHHFVSWLIRDLKSDKRFEFLGTIGYTGTIVKNVQPIFIWKKMN